jgi:hypothetical protein
VRATVVVDPPENPSRLTLEPAQATLGVGATLRLKCRGTSADDKQFDLTEVAEWTSQDPETLFCSRGLVEGLRPGTGVVLARYRAGPDREYVDAAAAIEVVSADYEKLELALPPGRLIREDGEVPFRAIAVDTKGSWHEVTGSSRLQVTVEPPQVASAKGDAVRGKQPGKAELAARFGKLTTRLPIEVHPRVEKGFQVSPNSLELMTGEVAPVQVVSSEPATVQLASSAPAVAAVPDGAPEGRFLIRGVSAGSAEVTVTQGSQKAVVAVTVRPRRLDGLALLPAVAQVPVGEAVPLRVVGQVKGANGKVAREVDLAPTANALQDLYNPGVRNRG